MFDKTSGLCKRLRAVFSFGGPGSSTVPSHLVFMPQSTSHASLALCCCTFLWFILLKMHARVAYRSSSIFNGRLERQSHMQEDDERGSPDRFVAEAKAPTNTQSSYLFQARLTVWGVGGADGCGDKLLANILHIHKYACVLSEIASHSVINDLRKAMGQWHFNAKPAALIMLVPHAPWMKFGASDRSLV